MTQNKSKIKLETKHSPFTQNKKTLFLKLDSYRNANKHVPASIFLWICTMKLKSLICLNHKDKLNLIPLKYSTGSLNNNLSNQNLNCITCSYFFQIFYLSLYKGTWTCIDFMMNNISKSTFRVFIFFRYTVHKHIPKYK